MNMFKSVLPLLLRTIVSGRVDFIGVSVSDCKRYSYRNCATHFHSHNFIECVFPVAGRARLYLADRIVSLGKKRLYVVLPSVNHCERYDKRKNSYKLLWMTIGPGGVNFFVSNYDSSDGYYTVRSPLGYIYSDRLWELSKTADLSGNIVNRARFISSLLDVVSEAIEYMDKIKVSASPIADMVNQIKRYVEEHITEPITLSEVAHLVRRTPNYVNSVFKSYTGKAVKEYLIDVRISRAKELLSSTNLQIKKIAFECGFRDQLYFSRLFSKKVGLSPQMFRTQR